MSARLDTGWLVGATAIMTTVTTVTTTTTAAAAAATTLPLLESTEESPWSVDAVSAIPAVVYQQLQLSAAVSASAASAAASRSGVSTGRWHAVAISIPVSTVNSSNNNASSPARVSIEIYAWYAAGTLKEQKLNTSLLWQLHHEDASVTSSTTNDNYSSNSSSNTNHNSNDSTHKHNNHNYNHMQLAMASPSPDTAFVYAIHALTHRLVVWKLKLQHKGSSALTAVSPTRGGETQHHPYHHQSHHSTTTTTTKPLAALVLHATSDDRNETDPLQTSSSSSSANVTVTTLKVDWTEATRSPIILVGMSTGTLYWLVQTKVPVALRVIQVLDAASTRAPSFMGRLFWSSSTPTSATPPTTTTQQQQQHNKSNAAGGDEAIVACHTIAGSPHFVSVTRRGHVRLWHTRPTESSSQVIFTVESEFHLSGQWERNQPAHESPDSPRAPPPAEFTVVQTALSTAASSATALLHSIVLVKCAASDKSSTTKATSSEYRLYWMVVACGTMGVTEHASTTSGSGGPGAILDIHRSGEPVVVLSSTWLDRFAAPEEIRVDGFCAVDRGMTYALCSRRRIHATPHVGPATAVTGLAMQINSGTDDSTATASATAPAVTTTTASSTTIWAVDFATTVMQSILLHSMVPDVLTHGVVALDLLGGFGVRLRVEPVTVSPMALSSSSPPSGATRTATATTTLHTLSQQLKAAFGRFYADNQDVTVRLPPSLTTNATLDDLEAAAVHCAQQLAYSTASSASWGNPTSRPAAMHPILVGNPMDAHQAYINMLRHGGVYRNMSVLTKWQLLSIGQDVCVFMTLQQLASHFDVQSSNWQRDLFAQLTFENLKQWFSVVQDKCLTSPVESVTAKSAVWTVWLVQALQAAMMFREEHARILYDISPDQPPSVSAPHLVPTWTSSPAIRQVLTEQLEYWLEQYSTSGSSIDDVEDVVQKALLSCADSFRSCPGDETRAAYVRTQRDAFRLIRTVKGREGDEFLFELAVAHYDFQGVCQISFEHQSRRDSVNYDVVPLFAILANEEDVKTSMPFGRYVLTWHLDRKYYGLLLDYGKNCPEDLSFFLTHYEVLAPYRWVHAVRQGDFEAATASLVCNATADKVTLDCANSALCLASMTNSIVEREGSAAMQRMAAKHRCVVERKRELIVAQSALLGAAMANEDTFLWKPDRVINHAIRKAEEASELNDKVQLFVHALAASSTEDDDELLRTGALLVWVRAILADRALFEHMLTSQPNLTNSTLLNDVLDETVFGLLHQQCEKIPEWQSVSFCSVRNELFGGSEMVSQLDPLLEHSGLQRLLISATAALVKHHGTDQAPTEAMSIA